MGKHRPVSSKDLWWKVSLQVAKCKVSSQKPPSRAIGGSGDVAHIDSVGTESATVSMSTSVLPRVSSYEITDLLDPSSTNLQIAKVLHVSKTMINGAAGSMEAMDHALRALTEFLIIVLQDEANISSLDDTDIDLNMDNSPLSFLEELCHLKKQDHGQLVEKKSIQESLQSDAKKSLNVEHTRDWITTTSSHVNKLLSAILPHAHISVLNVAGKAKSVNGAVKIGVFEPVSEIYTYAMISPVVNVTWCCFQCAQRVFGLAYFMTRFPRCQKWMHNDVADLKESFTSSWFK
ncbi:Armadillo-like helical [Artemisia annua]|uniref:Armadillo-like helical n=1 Tax=Artemisia annua TaxID=35608 RepID=A0A2U1LFZ4_ARTAN|nr:Armadillo-like helical [Artemisia annua]